MILETIETSTLQASEEGVIRLPSGATIRTSAPPPAGFDPLHASDSDLTAHGLPGRPAEEALAKPWAKMLQHRLVQPSFQRIEQAGPSTLKGVVTTSYNFAGGTVEVPGPQQVYINGSITVPNVFPPAGAAEGRWYSTGAFIALADNISAIRLGVQCRVMSSFGSLVRQIFPYWELTETGAYNVVGITVSPGDVLTAQIQLDMTRKTAQMALGNDTSGAGAVFSVTSPSGSTLPAAFGHWLIEALVITGPPPFPDLARFGRVYFEGVCGANGAAVGAGSENLANMANSSGKTIATAVAETPYEVMVYHG